MSMLRNGSAESDKKKKPFAQGTSVNQKSMWVRSADTTLPSSELQMQFTRKKVHHLSPGKKSGQYNWKRRHSFVNMEDE
jgi:hypothetical protein